MRRNYGPWLGCGSTSEREVSEATEVTECRGDTVLRVKGGRLSVHTLSLF